MTGTGAGSTSGKAKGGLGKSSGSNAEKSSYRSHGKYKKKTPNMSKWGIYLGDWYRLKKKTREKWDKRWKRSAKKRGGHDSKYYLSEKRFKKWVKKKRKRIEKEISWTYPGLKSNRKDYERLKKQFDEQLGGMAKDNERLRKQMGWHSDSLGGQQGWYNQAQEQQRMFEQQQAAMARQYEQQALDYQKQIQAFNVANQQAQYSTMMAQRAPMAVAPNESGTNAYSDRWFRRDSPSTTASSLSIGKPVDKGPSILPIQTPSISLI